MEAFDRYVTQQVAKMAKDPSQREQGEARRETKDLFWSDRDHDEKRHQNNVVTSYYESKATYI